MKAGVGPSGGGESQRREMGAAVSRRAKSEKNLVLKSEPRGALIIDTGTGEMKLIAAMKVGDGAPVEFHELAIHKGDTMTMVVALSSGDTTGFNTLCTTFLNGTVADAERDRLKSSLCAACGLDAGAGKKPMGP